MEKIFKKIFSSIKKIKGKDIYAFVFLIKFDENCRHSIKTEYGIYAQPELVLLYNLESNCSTKKKTSEEKWNIAYWEEASEVDIIDDESLISLLDFYNKKGITKVGFEDENTAYNEDMEYVGKGPNGLWELAELLVNIVDEIRKFDFTDFDIKKIPFIICDYDYSWYTYYFTKKANQNGQAKYFLKSYKKFFN